MIEIWILAAASAGAIYLLIALFFGARVFPSWLNPGSYGFISLLVFFLIPSIFYFDATSPVWLLYVLHALGCVAGLFLARRQLVYPSSSELQKDYAPDLIGGRAALIGLFGSLCIFFIFFGFAVPPLFGEDPELARGEYLSDKAKALRIINYGIPFFGFIVLSRLKAAGTRLGMSLFYGLLALLCILSTYGGNKSNVFSLLLMWIFFRSYIYPPGQNRSGVAILILAILSIGLAVFISVPGNFIGFLAYRLFDNNLAGLRLSIEYVDREGFLFGDGILVPLKILFSKLAMIDYQPRWQTLGNFMAKYESGAGDDYPYEYLNTMIGDAYLDFGPYGVFAYPCLSIFAFSLFFRCVKLNHTASTRMLWFCISYAFMQMTYIGKVGSYFTSAIASYLSFWVIQKIIELILVKCRRGKGDAM